MSTRCRGRVGQSGIPTRAARLGQPSKSSSVAIEEPEDPKLAAIRDLIEKLTGYKVRTLRLRDLQGDPAQGADRLILAASRALSLVLSGGRQGATHALTPSVHAESAFTEDQPLGVSAHGIIETADGRRFQVDLGAIVKTSFSQTRSSHVGPAQPQDPLVLGLGAPGVAGMAGMSGGLFAFDVNSDRSAEVLHKLTNGSGMGELATPGLRL